MRAGERATGDPDCNGECERALRAQCRDARGRVLRAPVLHYAAAAPRRADRRALLPSFAAINGFSTGARARRAGIRTPS